MVLDGLKEMKAHRATSYLESNIVVRGTRPTIGPKGKKSFDRSVFKVVLSIGRPNARERDFIKSWKKKTGMRYPNFGTIAKPSIGVWFQYLPKPKKVAAKNRR